MRALIASDYIKKYIDKGYNRYIWNYIIYRLIYEMCNIVGKLYTEYCKVVFVFKNFINRYQKNILINYICFYYLTVQWILLIR